MRLLVVQREGQVFGGGFIAPFRDTVHCAWAGVLRDSRDFRPSHLLYWETMQYGSANGYQWVDFGRSRRDSGSFTFKKSWGRAAADLPAVLSERHRPAAGRRRRPRRGRRVSPLCARLEPAPPAVGGGAGPSAAQEDAVRLSVRGQTLPAAQPTRRARTFLRHVPPWPCPFTPSISALVWLRC